MFRVLFIAFLIVALPRSIGEAPPQGPTPPDPSLAVAERISGSVRARFALAVRAEPCRHADNLFGYNLVMSRFSGPSAALLVAAAQDGRRQGLQRRLAGEKAVPCGATLDALRQADDGLVMLSERLARDPVIASR